eukprot:g15536.t1
MAPPTDIRYFRLVWGKNYDVYWAGCAWVRFLAVYLLIFALGIRWEHVISGQLDLLRDQLEARRNKLVDDVYAGEQKAIAQSLREVLTELMHYTKGRDEVQGFNKDAGNMSEKEFHAFFDRAENRTETEQETLSTVALLNMLHRELPPLGVPIAKDTWKGIQTELLEKLSIEYGGHNGTEHYGSTPFITSTTGWIRGGAGYLDVAMDAILHETEAEAAATMSTKAWRALMVDLMYTEYQKHLPVPEMLKMEPPGATAQKVGLRQNQKRLNDALLRTELGSLKERGQERGHSSGNESDSLDGVKKMKNESESSRVEVNFTSTVRPLWREQIHPYVNTTYRDRLIAGRLLKRLYARAVKPGGIVGILHADVLEKQKRAGRGGGAKVEVGKALAAGGHPGANEDYQDGVVESQGEVPGLEVPGLLEDSMQLLSDIDFTAHESLSTKRRHDSKILNLLLARKYEDFVDLPPQLRRLVNEAMVVQQESPLTFRLLQVLPIAALAGTLEKYHRPTLHKIIQLGRTPFSLLLRLVLAEQLAEHGLLDDSPGATHLGRWVASIRRLLGSSDSLRGYDRGSPDEIGDSGVAAKQALLLLQKKERWRELERVAGNAAVGQKLAEALSKTGTQRAGQWPFAAITDVYATFFQYILEALHMWLGFYLPLSFLYRFFGQGIFTERERGLMEIQFIYGLPKFDYWVANVVFFFCVLALPFLVLHWANLFVLGNLIDLDRLWTPGELLFVRFVMPFCAPLSALTLSCALAVLIDKRTTFEGVISFIGGLGSLLFLLLYVGVEIVFPTRLSFWSTVASGVFSQLKARPPQSCVPVTVSSTMLNVAITLLAGTVVPGYSHVRILQRGYQLLHALTVMRHQGVEQPASGLLNEADSGNNYNGRQAGNTDVWMEEGSGLSPLHPRLQKHPGHFNVGMRPHSLYYCARDGSVHPPKDALLRDPVFDVFQISTQAWRYEDGGKLEAYADKAGAVDLSEQLGFWHYGLPVFAEYLTVVLNVVFSVCLLQYCEYRRHVAEVGDVPVELMGLERASGATGEGESEVHQILPIDELPIEEGEELDENEFLDSQGGGMSLMGGGMSLMETLYSAPTTVVTILKPPPEQEPPIMELKGLTKSFSGKLANNEISFSVERGEIFGLLGHNGAGKTTLFSQVSCMIPCTRGDVVVDGCSIRNDVAGVRRKLAFCPQTNPLWDAYTLRQHVEYFARLRGVPEPEIEPTLFRYATLLGLEKKVDTNCEKLSGGQKRRLWVLCSLLGNAPLILMDEATSGMDPQARRDFWALLKKVVREERRSIVFSTHYLEEADLLADRKLILAGGKVVAQGTSAELKRQWGAGFWIHAMVEKQRCPDNVKAKHLLEKVIAPVVASVLGIQEKELQTRNDRVSDYFLAYSVPWDYVEKMADVLDAMSQADKEKLLDITVEQITLQEVFTLAGEAAERLEQRPSTVVRDRAVALRDQKISRLPLRPRSLRFALQWRALFEFRVYGEGRRLLGSVAAAVCFVVVWWVAMSKVQKEEEALQETMHRQRDQDARAYAAANGISIAEARERQKVHVKMASGNKNLGAGFLAMGVAYVISPLAFHFFGANAVKNAYAVEEKLGLCRHLRMHGSHNSAYHCGSGLCFLTFITFPFWTAYGVSFMATMPDVFAGCWPAGFTFWVLVVFFSMVCNLMVPMLLTRTLSPATWTLWCSLQAEQSDGQDGASKNAAPVLSGFVLCLIFPFFGIRSRQEAHHLPGGNAAANGLFTPLIIPRVADAVLNKQGAFKLDVGSWTTEDNMHINCDQLTKLISLRGANVAPFVMGFGQPHYWGLLFLPLSILFPPVATARALCGMYKLWALTVMTPSPEDSTSAGTTAKGAEAIRRQRLNEDLQHGDRESLHSIDYFMFGRVPERLRLYVPEMQDVGPSILSGVLSDEADESVLSGMQDGYVHLNYAFDQSCNAFYFQMACWVEVWAPVWCFLFYVLLFLFYELWYIPRRQVGTRFAGPEELGRSCGEEPPAPDADELRDPDVVAEEKRPVATRIGQALDCVGLYKHFGDQTAKKLNWATKGVTLGVPVGECFALLGPNGAGKTTLFSMVTGNEVVGGPDLGTIAVLDKDTAADTFAGAQEVTGLAPQFDKLWPHVSGRKHLRLFSKICGMYHPPDEATAHDYGEERISRLLREVSLSEADADRKTEEYSGGMKRKLSVALTMITDPSIVFLDEMSAGVDIVAQRSLWNKLIYRPKGQTIISTTHSMMEAEATADRIGILVGGRLKALGTTHHIKARYGSGYHLELIVNLEGVAVSVQRVQLAPAHDDDVLSEPGASTPRSGGGEKGTLTPLKCTSSEGESAPEGEEKEMVAALFINNEPPKIMARGARKSAAEQKAAAVAYDQQLRRSREVAPMPPPVAGKNTNHNRDVKKQHYKGTAITFDNIESIVVDSLLDFGIGLERHEIRVLEKILFSEVRVKLCLTLGWLPDVFDENGPLALTPSKDAVVLTDRGMAQGAESLLLGPSMTGRLLSRSSGVITSSAPSKDDGPLPKSPKDDAGTNVAVGDLDVSALNNITIKPLPEPEGEAGNPRLEEGDDEGGLGGPSDLGLALGFSLPTSAGRRTAQPGSSLSQIFGSTAGSHMPTLAGLVQRSTKRSNERSTASTKRSTQRPSGGPASQRGSRRTESEPQTLIGASSQLSSIRLQRRSSVSLKKLDLAAVFRWCVKDTPGDQLVSLSITDPVGVLEDYSFGEPTLEQVFLKFAREQEFLEAAKEQLLAAAGAPEGDGEGDDLPKAEQLLGLGEGEGKGAGVAEERGRGPPRGRVHGKSIEAFGS